MKTKVKAHLRRVAPKTESLITHAQLRVIRKLVRHAEGFTVHGNSFKESVTVVYHVTPNSDSRQALIYRDGCVIHQ